MKICATSKSSLSLKKKCHSSVTRTNSQNCLCRALYIISGVLGFNLSYIGSAKLYWEKCLEEHHKSALTADPLKSLEILAPMQHVRRSCSHESSIMGHKDFKIIGCDSNPFLLKLKESIFTSKLCPQLSGTKTSIPLYIFNPILYGLFDGH